MHLTRQMARELPSFIEAPDFAPARGFLLTPALRIPVRRDGDPVATFLPGWTPDAISLLFYPTVILQFRHANGETAFWLLDPTFTFIGTTVTGLPSRSRTRFQQRATRIATFLSGLAEATLPCRIPDDIRSFLKLANRTRQDILAQVGHGRVGHDPDWTKFPQASPTTEFFAPVETDLQGVHRIRDGERAYPLRMGDRPVSLLPGWRIPRVSSLFFPLFIADLQHEDGRSAYWFFDRQGNHRGDHWSRLPEAASAVLAGHAAAILEELWQDLVAHPGDRTSEQVAAFLALPAGIRQAVFDFQRSPPRPASTTSIWSLHDSPPDTLAYVAQTERGPALLDRASLHKSLDRHIQEQNIRLANEGVISWPSPINGRELPTTGFALLLDSLCFAYRVQDVEAGLTFYIVAGLGHFRTFGLYLPENDLLISEDPGTLAEMRQYLNVGAHLLRHAIYFADTLLAGWKKPVGDLVHTLRGRHAIHIGHFIWQDLSGIHNFLKAVRPDRIPQFLVPESALKPEIYGPLDRLFPSLEGKVVRQDEDFIATIARIYAHNDRVIKATSMYVPRQIGTAILSGYKASPECRDLVAACQQARRQPGPIVLLGLRMGNRTLADIGPFSVRLAAAIYEAFPDATIIIDGQNASADAVYDSFGDDPSAPDSFLRQELDIARELADYASARGFKLVNNIGRPLVDSLLWCDAADLFVAPWGAALAKYRWVCNKPGLVFTGRWNLNHRRDLSIYHGPTFNEAPSEMWFNDPTTVEDLIDPAETDPSAIERANFKIDFAAIQAQVILLLKSKIGANTRAL